MKYPHVMQHDEKDCGAACLSMISEYYGLKLPITRFRELIGVDIFGSNIYGIIKGADKIGLSAKALEGKIDELILEIEEKKVTYPFIARIINEESYEHFVVIYKIINGKVYIGDPSKEQIVKISFAEFAEAWQGQIIIFKVNEKFVKGNKRKKTLKKFWIPILVQKKKLLLVFAVSLVISGIGLFSASAFGHIVDNIVTMNSKEETPFLTHEDMHLENHGKESENNILDEVKMKIDIIYENLGSICSVVIILYLIQALLQVGRSYILAIVTRNIDIPFSLGYYNHLIDLPMKFFGTRKTGELMSRFSDVSNIRDAISTATLTIMLDTVMAGVTGIYLFTLNIKLFLITAIIMMVYTAIVLGFRKPIKKVNRDIMEKNAHVTAYLKESIDGIETIKAYKYEENSKEKTKDFFIRYVNKVVRGTIIYNILNISIGVIESVGLVILLWVGAYLCARDVITIGTLITFYYLLDYFLNPIKNLIELQPSLQTAGIAAERLNDVLDVSVEDNSKKDIDNLRGDIKIENICFRYGNRNPTLNNINAEISQGTKVAFVGESGCGKTTLAKLLMNFYIPETGNIIIGGKNIVTYSPRSIRKHIVYVSQNVFLLSDTIYNNLRMGQTDITNEEIQAMCQLCSADEFIQKLPFGYETMLEENGNNLSAGQKQRLAIIRALLKKPDILILDEATSNLDTVTERNITKIINQVCSNITVIIIAHRLWTVRDCDYIYVMQDGEIKEEGNHNSLLDRKGIYDNYWKNQI